MTLSMGRVCNRKHRLNARGLRTQTPNQQRHAVRGAAFDFFGRSFDLGAEGPDEGSGPDEFVTTDPVAAKGWAETLIDPGLRGMAFQEVATAAEGLCSDCRTLYQGAKAADGLRAPIDLHRSHQHH